MAETEAAVCRCSSKYLFLKISQYSQENTCLLNIVKFVRTDFFYKTPPVVVCTGKILLEKFLEKGRD